MKVTIAFHGPFRVATGVARADTHEAVDADDLLPASSLKGLMRAAARLLLPGGNDLITEVYGSEADRTRTPHTPSAKARVASPWHWSDAEFTGEGPRTCVRTRVSIDNETGTAKRGHLVSGEEVWAESATFTVTRRFPLYPETARRHRVVLAASAAAVHALGADRRRGLGWVSMTPEDPAIDEALLADLATLRSMS
ncbi:RAMP superfamily CRISPR-associated protein [Rhizohabitans arisaemae]|uniref:RAMP superfamily CRISPR-associated protein n=1 Tax=Rhizohabitans arisaemae TaxID=2720610 RepID=UPI0024B06D31|nr:RAMP superfamily CRISPR-associated protein [Rhizohabitans arisaemae]